LKGLRKSKPRRRPAGSIQTFSAPSGFRPESIVFEGSIMDAVTGANTKTGTLNVDDKKWTFPVYDGTIGPSVVDIAKLYGTAGMFTYDPGFTSTASCESKITYIDGDAGVLL